MQLQNAKVEKKLLPNHQPTLDAAFRYDLRPSAAKDNSITPAAAAARSLCAAIFATLDLCAAAKPQLQNIPKLDLDAKAEKDDFGAHFTRNSARKIISAKMQNRSAAKALFVTFMQPLQCDLRLAAAKGKSIAHAAAAARNLYAATPLQSAKAEFEAQ